MSEIDILSKMIHKRAQIPLKPHYEAYCVELAEQQAQDSRVTILNVPSDAVVIKLDISELLSRILGCKNDECKCADYVLISAEKKCILYIEIKQTKDDTMEIIKQLMGAQCFVRYLQEIGRSFWQKYDFLDDYQHRFISVDHTSVAKGKMRCRKDTPVHDTPARLMTVSHPHSLQFKSLL